MTDIFAPQTTHEAIIDINMRLTSIEKSLEDIHKILDETASKEYVNDRIEVRNKKKRGKVSHILCEIFTKVCENVYAKIFISAASLTLIIVVNNK